MMIASLSRRTADDIEWVNRHFSGCGYEDYPFRSTAPGGIYGSELKFLSMLNGFGVKTYGKLKYRGIVGEREFEPPLVLDGTSESLEAALERVKHSPNCAESNAVIVLRDIYGMLKKHFKE